MPAHPSPVQNVVLVDLSDNTRWALRFEADAAFLRGPDGSELGFSRARIGASCDFTTRDERCTVIMPTPGRVRSFGCSVTELQPFLEWIRQDLAPFEHARLGRELVYAVPLGLLWILAGSPVISHGYSYMLLGYGAALIVVGIVGRLRPHRYLLLVDAALWFAIAVQNARVAYAGSGVLAVVMTLFSASFGFRILRLFAFHRALAQDAPARK
ncbi:MAG: hypothetical protein U0270_37535 [Labilithrix sp.]